MPKPGVLCGYVFFFLILATACSFNYGSVPQQDDEPNLLMEEVEYTRIVNGNPEIRIKAEEVRRYETKHIMEMADFSFEQYNTAPEGQKAIPGVNAWGRAGHVRLETDTNNFFMGGNITINVASEDIRMQTEDISWVNEDRSLNAPGAVHISRSSGTTLTGTGLSVDVRSRSWEFESAVAGSIVEDE